MKINWKKLSVFSVSTSVLLFVNMSIGAFATTSIKSNSSSSTTKISSVAVGSIPVSMAFGNGNLYVVKNDYSVSVINLAKDKVISTIKNVGADPSDITYGNGYVYAMGEYATGKTYGVGNVSVINTKTNTVKATIPVGRSPSAITYENGYVYVLNQSSSTVSVINTKSLKVISTINVSKLPTGIAYKYGRLYILHDTLVNPNSGVDMINTATNKLTTKTPNLGIMPFIFCYGNKNLYVGGQKLSEPPNSKVNGTLFVINETTDKISKKLNLSFQTSNSITAYGGGNIYLSVAPNWNIIHILSSSSFKNIATSNLKSYSPTNMIYAKGFLYLVSILTNSKTQSAELTVMNIKDNKVTKEMDLGTDTLIQGLNYYHGYVFVAIGNVNGSQGEIKIIKAL